MMGRLFVAAVEDPGILSKSLNIIQALGYKDEDVSALAEISQALVARAERDKLKDLWIAQFKRSMMRTRSGAFFAIQQSAESIAKLDAGVSLVHFAEEMGDLDTWWSIG
jgi:hypothetical protein